MEFFVFVFCFKFTVLKRDDDDILKIQKDYHVCIVQLKTFSPQRILLPRKTRRFSVRGTHIQTKYFKETRIKRVEYGPPIIDRSSNMEHILSKNFETNQKQH